MIVDKHDGLVGTVRITKQEANFLINCVRLGLSMTPSVSGQAMAAHLLEALEDVSKPTKFFPMRQSKKA